MPLQQHLIWCQIRCKQHFWARGYFVVSSGSITDEMIMEYIEKQDLEDKDGDFKISGE